MLLHTTSSANKNTSPVMARSWYDDESESSGCYDEAICVETMCKKLVLLSQNSEATLDTMASSSTSWTPSNTHENDDDDNDDAWSWYSSDDNNHRETTVRFATEDDVLEFEMDEIADLGALFYSVEEIDAFRQVFEQELEDAEEEQGEA